MSFFNEVNIDKVRRYWDDRPCNVRHSSEKVGTKKYFEEVENRKYFVEPHILDFAEFHRWKGKKVLEIGCGIGTDTINFARAGALVTAVDISEKSLKIAQKRAEVFDLKNKINFYHANTEELSSVLPIETYDLVYSFGVIHHTPNPYRAIEQIRKYMDDGSSLKIMVYYRYSWKVFWILTTYGKGQFWKLDELIARYSEAQTGCPVTYTYTKNSIKDLLNNFTIREIRINHIFPYSIPEYVQYKYKKLWYIKILPSCLFRWLEQHFGWHLCVDAKYKD